MTRRSVARRDPRILGGAALLALAFVAGCAAIPASGSAPLPPTGEGSPPRVEPTTRSTPAIVLPPGATLETPAGHRTEAALGSYTYRGAGSDSPWLPADTLDRVDVSAGASLTICLTDRTGIASARAVVADAADRAGEETEGVAISGPDPTGALLLTAPPRGSWVLMVLVEYAGGSGSAAYYWRLETS
ncbi:MAG TPA: hypothetical protein VGQ47_03375 [Candidatus Limnocylindrales bacterium]|jgi:hypothetical protein|nr:hypothetical protein [Candidatus Limnocylindrales bacterium]